MACPQFLFFQFAPEFSNFFENTTQENGCMDRSCRKTYRTRKNDTIEDNSWDKMGQENPMQQQLYLDWPNCKQSPLHLQIVWLYWGFYKLQPGNLHSILLELKSEAFLPNFLLFNKFLSHTPRDVIREAPPMVLSHCNWWPKFSQSESHSVWKVCVSQPKCSN